MGLNPRNNSNYIRKVLIKHHNLCLESKVKIDGWTHRQVPDLRKKRPDGTYEMIDKWYLEFGSLDGVIKRIVWEDSENRIPGFRLLSLDLYVEDQMSGKTVVLSLPYNSNFFTQFCKQGENIDFRHPVHIEVWHDTKADKPNKTAFKIEQFGHPVKWKWTKDSEDLPNPTVNAAGIANYDAQNDWLFRRMMDVVIPHVDSLSENWQPDFDDLCYPTQAGEVEAVHEPELPTHTGGFAEQARPAAVAPAPTTHAPVSVPRDSDDIPF